MQQREWLAAAIALVIGSPLVFFFATAMADGAQRAAQTPYRALLGDEAYEALRAGRETNLHYAGNDRLAPDFDLRDRSGRSFKLSDHRGKVVVMNFWTITCAPCVEEMPSLDLLAELVADRDDVEVIAVSTDAGWDEVATVFPDDPTIRVLFDPEESVVEGRYGTKLYPETWFIDPDGVIRLRIDGPRDWTSPIVLDLIDQLAG
ncbi:MAG TPA: TlpA disulfide reductase family protein [Polyangiaceae bacterium LLY-WYZ-14_1]|nr:TlpA disulfide reductase family protein [Polyangiaceae bacterium LLY-WYZ-14_1]